MQAASIFNQQNLQRFQQQQAAQREQSQSLGGLVGAGLGAAGSLIFAPAGAPAGTFLSDISVGALFGGLAGGIFSGG